MDSLSERLRSLGVRLGSERKEQRPTQARFPVDDILPGDIQATARGEAYVVERQYPWGHAHGAIQLHPRQPSGTLASWAGDPQLVERPLDQILFLDTETTGLAGGTGTFAFLVGVGRFTSGGFQVQQFFMRDPVEEPALLAALETCLEPCQVVVTFNGKSFDWPMLTARYISNGWPDLAPPDAHLDLLHLARRLWRYRLPSRALGVLEQEILGLIRAEEDIPGWMIPQIYFDYLRTRDARPLKGVFYHNAMDILSLAALMIHADAMLEDPLDGADLDPVDLFALGRLMEDLEENDRAVRLYSSGLERDLPVEIETEALRRLSMIQKRSGNFPRAIALWERAAREGAMFAFVELAKYYEHRVRRFDEALHWTRAALDSLSAARPGSLERVRWRRELERRQARLERRISSTSG